MNRLLPGIPSLPSLPGILALVIVCCALFFCPPSLRAADALNGNLLIEAKGDVEVYHNGRKIFLRDKADDKQHFRVKVPERAFNAGDVVVLHVHSPYVFRAIAVALNLTGNAGQVAIKKGDWRFLGEGKNPASFTADQIEASKSIPKPGRVDPDGESEREKLGMLPASRNGSDWVETERELKGWYCIGFVITPDMLKVPMLPHL